MSKEEILGDEIYIKRSYDVQGIRYDDLEGLENYKNRVSQLRENSLYLHDLTDPIWDELIEAEAKQVDSEYNVINNRKDYSWADWFWHLRKTNDWYNISTITHLHIDEEREYNTLEDVNRDFISLMDFLEKAEYVGRYFKRTAPHISDGSYMEEDKSCFILYKLEDVAICKVISINVFTGEDEERFEVLSGRYLEDGNYKYYGDVIDSFDDKVGIYNEIYNQSFGDGYYNKPMTR